MQLSSSARSQYSHTPMDLTTTTLEALSKRELERLCREHQLSPHGLKAQLLTGLRAHRASLTTSASSNGQPVTPSQPSTSSSQTATDAPPFTPEQQACIARIIAEHTASRDTGASTSTQQVASAPAAGAVHGGVGESPAGEVGLHISAHVPLHYGPACVCLHGEFKIMLALQLHACPNRLRWQPIVAWRAVN